MKNLFNRKSAPKAQSTGKGRDRTRARLALQLEDNQDALSNMVGMKKHLSCYEERDRGIASFGPLRSFLNARLGLHISVVEADLHKRAGKGHSNRADLIHIYERLVEQHVELKPDGIYAHRWGKKLQRDFYVHPEQKTLEKVPSEAEPVKKLLYEQVKVGDRKRLVKLNGLWFMVSFKPLLPNSIFKVMIFNDWLIPAVPLDIILKREAIDYSTPETQLPRYPHFDIFVEAWGEKIYAESKRAANRYELRMASIR